MIPCYPQSHFTVPSPTVETRCVKQHVPHRTAVELRILSSHLREVTLNTIKSWSSSHLFRHAHACPCSSSIFMETPLGNRYLTSIHTTPPFELSTLRTTSRRVLLSHNGQGLVNNHWLFEQPGKRLACPLHYQLFTYSVVRRNLHEKIRPDFTYE